MRDETLPLERRIDAAKAAAPFVHPRLAAAERSETAVPIYIQISAHEALL
jgi:hypothetical protein